jgi:hypothetical protein
MGKGGKFIHIMDIKKPPKQSMEMLSYGREDTGSGVYNPSSMLLGLLVAHITHPLIYFETISFIRG